MKTEKVKEKRMKKIGKVSELFWLLGMVFVALGVTICKKANLGLSMIAASSFVINEYITGFFSRFSVGMTDYLFQGLLLIILCVLIRRFSWRYLLAFAEAVIYGNVLNLFIFLFEDVSFESVALRWVMLIVGCLTTALGVACFFRTYLPLQIYELFVSEFSRRFKLSINKVKWIFDFSLLALAALLAFTLFGDAKSFDWSTIGYRSFHSIGLGTVVITLINSPVIALFGKILDRFFEPTPLFPKAVKYLKRS